MPDDRKNRALQVRPLFTRVLRNYWPFLLGCHSTAFVLVLAGAQRSGLLTTTASMTERQDSIMAIAPWLLCAGISLVLLELICAVLATAAVVKRSVSLLNVGRICWNKRDRIVAPLMVHFACLALVMVATATLPAFVQAIPVFVVAFLSVFLLWCTLLFIVPVSLIEEAMLGRSWRRSRALIGRGLGSVLLLRFSQASWLPLVIAVYQLADSSTNAIEQYALLSVGCAVGIIVPTAASLTTGVLYANLRCLGNETIYLDQTTVTNAHPSGRGLLRFTRPHQ